MKQTSNPMRTLVTSVIVVPLLPQQAHLAWQFGIMVHRVHFGLRPLLPFLPWQPAQRLWHYENQPAEGKLPGQFQLEFSQSFRDCMCCLQQLNLLKIFICFVLCAFIRATVYKVHHGMNSPTMGSQVDLYQVCVFLNGAGLKS